MPKINYQIDNQQNKNPDFYATNGALKITNKLA